MTKLTLGRAVTAHVGRRLLRLATVITMSIFGAVLLMSAGLAYFFSVWWWLVLVPFIVLLGAFFVIRFFVLFIIRRIHAEQITSQQQTALNQFSDKVQSLLEARATPLPVLALISLKDLILHRDIVTVKRLINDSASLLSDYKNIEKLF